MAFSWGDDRNNVLDTYAGFHWGVPGGYSWNGGLSNLRPFGQPKTAAAADPNRFGIDRGAKDYAAQTQAALLRADWDYSKAELTPVLSRLRYMYENPNGEQEAIQGSRSAAVDAFDRGQRSTEFNMRRAGLTLTPEQQQAFDQVSGLQRGLSSTGAANTGARGYADLKDQIATGSSGLTSANAVQPKLKFGG